MAGVLGGPDGINSLAVFPSRPWKTAFHFKLCEAEAVLDKRAKRVERPHIRPLAPGDRARFVESWGRVEARFVDGPGGAVTDADQLLGDVMSRAANR